MISRIESPREDETLPSFIARVLTQIPRAPRKFVAQKITGIEGSVASVDLPMNLQAVVDALGRHVGLDGEEMVRRLTMLPLYAPFVTPERHARVKAAMLRGGAERPAAMLGLHRCSTPAPAVLRFCPTCRELDRQGVSFAWWRRLPQVAGVDWCPLHGPLSNSQFRRRGHWKVDYPQAEDAQDVARESQSDEYSTLLAEDVRDLLAGDFPPAAPEALRAAYFELMQSRGYVIGDRLRRTDLLHEFLVMFGGDRLGRLGLAYDPRSPYAWPAKLALAQGDCHPPLRHLHLIRFFGVSAKAFMGMVASSGLRRRPSRGPSAEIAQKLREMWPNRSLSLAQIARSLGVQEQTARTWGTGLGLRVPRGLSTDGVKFEARRYRMREAWLKLRDGNGGRRTRVLRWLSRNDHAWFAAHAVDRRTPHYAAMAPDWEARDQVLAGVVSSAALKLKSVRPFRRVSRTGIAETLRIAGIVQGAGKRLPKFTANVDAVVEHWRSYALRRVETLRADNPAAPPWMIRDKASIPRPLPKDPELLQALGYAADHKVLE